METNKKPSPKTLINDSRLTPTMERTRSGRTQLFREKNPYNRNFISSENCDVSLQHDKKSMYAELIDGLWYWVEGCAECKGEKRGWNTYIECEEHDRCRTCNTKRKDVKGVPWGGRNGWQCKSCNDIEEKEIRRQAFEKFNKEQPREYDFRHMDEIQCPHCGSKIYSDETHETQEIECHVCEGKLLVEVEYTVSYSTSIIGERVTE